MNQQHTATIRLLDGGAMTITYYRIRIYVGPVHVEHYAAQARRNGLTDVFAGTEHVYGTYATETHRNETDRLLSRHRVGELVYGEPGMWWRDVEILGS